MPSTCRSGGRGFRRAAWSGFWNRGRGQSPRPQRLCPELLAADLVRPRDGTWLDVLRWTCPGGEERLMQHADRFGVVHTMHELLEVATQVGRGEIVVAAE